MTKHISTEYIPAGLGDDSSYSVCAGCGQKIEIFGAYDDDRGVVMDKKGWRVVATRDYECGVS